MRRWLLIVVVWVFLLEMHYAFAREEKERTLITIGPDSNYSIVTSKDATVIASFAAKELQHYVEKITGAKLPIKDDSQIPLSKEKLILVGPSKHTEKLGITFDSTVPDSFIVKTSGNILVLLGKEEGLSQKRSVRKDRLPFNYVSSPKGTLFAVYDFLERYCGVRWFWPGETGELIPESDCIELPKIDISESPDFIFRHIWLAYSYKDLPDRIRRLEFPLWYIRNKLGMVTNLHIEHSWARWIEGNKYFKDHPEYYALVDGKRQPVNVDKKGKPTKHGNQVCTSNPDVMNIFIRNIRKRYNPSETRLASIIPNDGKGFCECNNCLALDDPKVAPHIMRYESASLSNRIYPHFYNPIAQAIKKTHPDLYLLTAAYSYLKEPPKAKLEENIVVLITHNRSRYSDPDATKKFRKRIKDWAQKAEQFMLGEYYGDFKWLHLPHIHTVRIIADDMPYLKKNGFLGVSSESNADFATNHLIYYVAAKMLWNSSLKLEDILDDYYEKAYGGAGPKMREYFRFMETEFLRRKTGDQIGMGILPQLWPRDVIDKGYTILEEARKIAQGKAKARIDVVHTGHELTERIATFFQLCQKLTDAGLTVYMHKYEKRPLKESPAPEQIRSWVKEAYQAKNALFQFVKKYEDTSLLQANIFFIRDKVFGWSETIDGYYGDYVVNAENTLPLPAVWRFRVDPDNTGEKKNWTQPGYDDSNWDEIRTDDFWEKQGYGSEKYPGKGGYDGYAWYRLNKVTVPGKYAGRKCFIKFGAVDESCWVWVNGKLAASFEFDGKKNPDSWKEPLELEITDHVRFGEENSMAVKVYDSSLAGGLWKRASLIFEPASSSNSGRTVFADDFEEESLNSNWNTANSKGDYEIKIVDDKRFQGEQALYIEVKAPYTSNFVAMTMTNIPVEGAKKHSVSLYYQMDEVEENEGLQAWWQRRPCVPSIRIRFYDSSGKVFMSKEDVIWVKGPRPPFKKKQTEWNSLRKIFETPEGANKASITIFFLAQGKYWIDTATLEKF